MKFEKLLTSDKVYISKSGIFKAGRGVLARVDIAKGEIIERCPIIEVPKNDVSILRESVLATYFFYFGKGKKHLAIALGFGSIYNHSNKANATFEVKPKKMIIEFVAKENIKKDTEITFNYYGSKKTKKKPLWFEV